MTDLLSPPFPRERKGPKRGFAGHPPDPVGRTNSDRFLNTILRLACKPRSVQQRFPGLHPILRRSSGHRLRPGPRAWAIISLCSLPETDNEASSLSSLLGLAPGGGYLAARITADAGGLLHRLFTVTALQRQFVSVALIRQVVLKEGFPSRGFPGTVLCGVRTFLDPAPKCGAAITRPAQGLEHHTVYLLRSQSRQDIHVLVDLSRCKLRRFITFDR